MNLSKFLEFDFRETFRYYNQEDWVFEAGFYFPQADKGECLTLNQSIYSFERLIMFCFLSATSYLSLRVAIYISTVEYYPPLIGILWWLMLGTIGLIGINEMAEPPVWKSGRRLLKLFFFWGYLICFTISLISPFLRPQVTNASYSPAKRRDIAISSLTPYENVPAENIKLKSNISQCISFESKYQSGQDCYNFFRVDRWYFWTEKLEGKFPNMKSLEYSILSSGIIIADS
jgi:hypothetical protein